MVDNVVRLISVEICDIKNVVHGKITLTDRDKGNILGLYGQNGSGKTVVADSMVLLKYLLSGWRIPV